MNIKHLQLNTSLLRSPEKILDFVKSNNIDIACLQEVVYPIGATSPIKPMFEEQGYFYIEGAHFNYLPNNQTMVVAIVSRWPIVDFQTWYYNTPTYSPKTITKDDQLFGDIIVNNYPDYPASRGLINEVKSRCILSALIETPGKLLRTISTHFTVSDLCVETSQMYQMSLMVNSIVKHSKDIPTIFSADMNIRPQSYSVAMISEVMQCHTANFTDTLSPTHRVKTNKVFPDGLAVDHVFSKGLTHNKTESIEIDFSEHKAMISEFEL